jgi:hypothetical protein
VGFRFRRSIKILSGIRLNLSGSGVSTSVGVKGAHITVGHGQVRETVGLSGSGLSYTHVEGAHKMHQEGQGAAQVPVVAEALPRGRAWRGVLWALLLMAIVAMFVRAMT